MLWRLLEPAALKLGGFIAEGCAGLLMLATAAFTWRDVPPLIAALGGAVMLVHAVIQVWRWIERRGEKRAELRRWRDDVSREVGVGRKGKQDGDQQGD